MGRDSDRRTGQPVRAGSRYKGECEKGWWTATTWKSLWRILEAAKRLNLAGKKRGDRKGPLGLHALLILEFLIRRVDRKTGRLEPSLETIMRELKLAKDTVVRALDALRRHGFLDWLRRCEKTGEPGIRGPQVRQVSNAYRLSLPSAAARLLRPLPPPPEDAEHQAAARESRAREWEREMPPAEYARATVEDPGLAQALGRLGEFVRNASRANPRSPQAC